MILLIIDVQEKLAAAIGQRKEVTENTGHLIELCKLHGIPVLLTEQYPKGLGHTVPELKDALQPARTEVPLNKRGEVRKEALIYYDPVEKLTFSACATREFMERFTAIASLSTASSASSSASSMNRDAVVLCGMETHVCVLQTCIDLLKLGYAVHVAGDATGSRRAENKEVGLQYMRDAGAVVTTTEIVLFQVLKKAATENFKSISKRIRG